MGGFWDLEGAPAAWRGTALWPCSSGPWARAASARSGADFALSPCSHTESLALHLQAQPHFHESPLQSDHKWSTRGYFALESGVQENPEVWREGWGVAAGHCAPVLGRAGDFGGLSSRHALGQAQHCPPVNPQAATVALVRSQRCL